MNTTLSVGVFFFLAVLAPLAQAETKCEVPKANKICIDQKQEVRRVFAPGKPLPPLVVAVHYGHKNVSLLLGETQYAPDYAPGLFQRRLVSDLNASGLFSSVYEADSASTSNSRAFKLTIVLDPMMKLTPASEAIGVGSVGLFALLGGELTTEFELTLRYSLRQLDGSELATDRYFISGMTTSSLYNEQQNVDRSWQTSVDFTLPPIYNFVITEMRRANATPPQRIGQNMERRKERRYAEPATVRVSPPGVRGPDPTTRSARKALLPVKDLQVLEIQRLLKGLGYDTGPADGIIGRRTREAIRQYQRSSDMTVDGKPSASLIASLKAEIARPTDTVKPKEASPPRRKLPEDELDDLESLDDF